jgi:hypothetical protein
LNCSICGGWLSSNNIGGHPLRKYITARYCDRCDRSPCVPVLEPPAPADPEDAEARIQALLSFGWYLWDTGRV